jgi:predicted transcriptional regulator
MTYKIGSIGQFKNWTKRVVTDPKLAKTTPKRWFDSESTAAKALGATTSPEAMVKLLSRENIALLNLIASRKPSSLTELAMLARRAVPNVSRTLKKLHEAGIIDFDEGPGKARVPRVTARRVTLELDLVGPSGVASVDPAGSGAKSSAFAPKSRHRNNVKI